MGLISYAQNFEDVMLSRALRDISNGFYIDIGAHDPVIDSVSLAFYKQGWRGIHVEALPKLAHALRVARPDETIIQAAVTSSNKGGMTFYSVDDNGLSTGDKTIADRHTEFNIREITVPTIRLFDIFDIAGSREIHWLKIDVEGMEHDVLRSWNDHVARPWVLIIESTFPRTQQQNYNLWEIEATTRDYEHVYFDGLNRYYLHRSQISRKEKFLSPPNVFDGFSVSGTSTFEIGGFIKKNYEQVIESLQLKWDSERDKLDQALAAKEVFRSNELQALREGYEKSVLSLKTILRKEKIEAEAKQAKLNEYWQDRLKKACEDHSTREQIIADSFCSTIHDALEKIEEETNNIFKEKEKFIIYTYEKKQHELLLTIQKQQEVIKQMSFSHHEKANLAFLLSLYDENLLNAAYHFFLGRKPDEKGAEHYLLRLRRGEDRMDILADIALSKEAGNANIVPLELAGYLRHYKKKKNSLFRKIIRTRNTPRDEINQRFNLLEAAINMIAQNNKIPHLPSQHEVQPAAAPEKVFPESKTLTPPKKPTIWWDENINPKKIGNVLILSTFPASDPRHGGQHRVHNIAKYYASLGAHIECAGVLGSPAYEPEFGYCPYPGRDHIEKYASNILMEDWALGEMFFRDDKYFKMLSRCINKKPDIIHIEHPWLFKFAERLINERYKNKVKLIYGSANIESDLKERILVSFNTGEDEILKAKNLVLACEQYAAQKADGVIAVSIHDLEWLKKRTTSPIVLAPNGVAKRSLTEEGLRKSSLITGNKKFALYCASEHPPNITGFFSIFSKGIGFVRPNQRLVFAGGVGPAIINSSLAKKVAGLSSYAIAPGKVDEDCLQGLIESAHVIILPITEGGGTNLKTAEALWSGKYVVATKTAMRGFEEFENVTGVFVSENAEDFRDILSRVMAMPPLELSDKEKAHRETVLWETKLSALNDLMDELKKA